MRAALESQAVPSILTSDNAANAVDELEAGFPRATPDMTYAECFELDLGFHEALCRLSGNETLLRMWTSIKDFMRISVRPTRRRAPAWPRAITSRSLTPCAPATWTGPARACGSHGDRSRRLEQKAETA